MRKSNLLTVLVIALSFVLSSCGGSTGSSNSPSKAVEKAFGYYLKKDYDRMAAMYANGEGKKLTKEELDKVKAMMPYATQQDEKKGGLKDFEIVEETIADDGNSAKVKVVKKYGNGKEDTDRLTLVKVDGDWLINVVSN